MLLLVLDLPQLYSKPSPGALLNTLDSLALRASTFAAPESPDAVVHQPELCRYLTSIISSRLAWIKDEAQREAIWAAASARLSERSGRTGSSSPQTHDSLTPHEKPELTRKRHQPCRT